MEKLINDLEYNIDQLKTSLPRHKQDIDKEYYFFLVDVVYYLHKDLKDLKIKFKESEEEHGETIDSRDSSSHKLYGFK